ncbi:MAG: pilus assembly protein PilM [Candidatus Sericytochromatia bacterium]|nr:pilus assembly protein PilM [Candidatus Tanganyikabacteria bacterium]
MAKKREFVGVYISPTKIEAAYFEDEEEEQPRLSAQGSIEIPEGVFNEDGDIVEIEQLGDLMKELWAEAEFKVWKAVIVLASKKAIVRQLRLPHMPAAALQQTVLSEAEQFALFRKEEPLVDYFISDPEGEFITVCFGAISGEVVRQYNEVCQFAGIKLLSVELVQLAGQRGIAYWYPPEEDYWTGVMVLQQRLIVSFWKDAKLQNIREILLPDRERISMELLAQNYIPEITRTIASDQEFFDDPHLVVGCDTLAESHELAGHVQANFNFLARVPGPSLEEAEAGQPAKARKKRKKSDDDEDEDDDEDDDEAPRTITVSYITVGAALWGAKGSVASFNLTKFASRKALAGQVSAQSLQRLFRNMPPLPIIGSAAGVIVSLGLMFGWHTLRMQTVSSLNQEISRIKGDIANLQTKEANLKPEETILRDWVPNVAEKEFATGFSGKLRDIIPHDTWVIQLSYQYGDTVKLHGAAMNQTSCLLFADELSQITAFAKVSPPTVMRRGPIYVYDITATIASQSLQAPKL